MVTTDRLIDKIVEDTRPLDEEQAHRTSKHIIENIFPDLAGAFARWIEENGFSVWNETEWFLEDGEFDHITDDKLFERFLNQYNP